MNRFFIAVFLMAIAHNANCQVLPRDNSSLNFRLVGFSFPAKSGSSYKVEIAEGKFDREDSFKKRIVKSVGTKENEVIILVPKFGRQYTWRIVYRLDKKSENSPFYHFNTKANVNVDSTKLRLRVLQPAAEQVKNYYVAGDWGSVLYDMTGSPVWFIPDTNGIGGYVGDLKFTPEHTITMICQNTYEINFDGGIVWKSPHRGTLNVDTTYPELYHHEFTKLSNGHYMALAMQMFNCKTVTKNDSIYLVTSKNDDDLNRNGFKPGKFGCLIEYDEKGKVVWSWKSFDYLFNADFYYFNPVDSSARFDAHDNAFFFDEKNKVIYIGFRNLNRIIKIEYPSGKVLRTYGKIYKPGVHSVGDGLFCGQHNIGKTSDGYLYYFNNNSCMPGITPSVVMLQEPTADDSELKKVWEYNCTVEGLFNGHFLNGGNAVDLPGKLMFINMGSKYSKWSIVNREKKVLWSALPERYIESDSKWVPPYEYRATIIARQELEKFIWKAERL